MLWIRILNQFHYSCYYYFIVINLCHFSHTGCSNIEINQPGGQFDIKIHYINLDSTISSGVHCDWQLHRCDVYLVVELYELTDDDADDNSNNNNNKLRLLFRTKTETVVNTAKFQMKISEKINGRLPEKYRLQIYAYDEDALGEHDLIIKAIGLFRLNKTSLFQEIPLNYSHESDSFRLSSSVKLTCNSNFYGNRCDLFCSPHPWAYECDANGRKICLHGRQGVNCDIIDYCQIHPCPKNTRCKNLPREHRRKCICKNYEGKCSS
ncbi:unnamed protein product [Schistosoma turkestanicum]|nr:unnamed protein product [Schistosoma turkestanicum]